MLYHLRYFFYLLIKEAGLSIIVSRLLGVKEMVHVALV